MSVRYKCHAPGKRIHGLAWLVVLNMAYGHADGVELKPSMFFLLPTVKEIHLDSGRRTNL